MLTAETISDEEILELSESFDDMTDQSQVDAYDICGTALHAPVRSERRMKARAWCADTLNARAEAAMDRVLSDPGMDPIIRVLRSWDWAVIAEDGVTSQTEDALLSAAKALAQIQQSKQGNK